MAVSNRIDSVMDSGLPTLERLSNRNPDAFKLAMCVSLASKIEPQLLRRARLHLVGTRTDPGIEADVWFSDLVQSHSPAGIVFEENIAHDLRIRLAEHDILMERAWQLIEELHRPSPIVVRIEEKINWLVLSGREEELRKLLRQGVGTLLAPSRNTLAYWIVRSLPRLPREVRSFEETQMLIVGAYLRLGMCPFIDEVPKGKIEQWRGWLAPVDKSVVTAGVRLLQGAVEFTRPMKHGTHRIEIPKRPAPLVEIVWLSQGTHKRQLVPLPERKTSTLEIDALEVEIHTLAGRSYILKSLSEEKLDRIRPPRVQITYDVETGGAIEMKELPFVVGVLCDLSGETNTGQPGLHAQDLGFLEIDRDNFDEVMKSVCPRVAIGLSKLSSGEKSELAVDLKFETLDDFSPEAIIRQVERLNAMLGIRVNLNYLLEKCDGDAALVSSLQNILLHKTVRNEIRKTVETDLDRRRKEAIFSFLQEVEEGRVTSSRNLHDAIKTRIVEIDQTISAHLNSIMHAPEFQNIEATWRGLNYLVEETETGGNLKIRVLNVSKQALRKDFEAATSFVNTGLFKKVYVEVFNTFGGEPYGVLIGDYEFGRTAQDIALLEGISHVAAAAHAPFLSAASPSLLSIDSFTDLPNPRDLAKRFETTNYSQWNSFRESDDSRYVGLMLPHILMRLPYGPDTSPVEPFNFKEDVDGTDHGKYLWGNTAYAMGARITVAFARYGWTAAIRGVEGGGKVEGLPTHTFQTADGEIALKCPTEVAVTDRREKELSDLGFIPLTHCKGTDFAAFFSSQSCQKQRKYDNDADNASSRLFAQFPYVLASSRFAHYLQCIMRDKVGTFMTRQDCEEFLNRWIAKYTVNDGEAPASTKAQFPLREARIEVEEVGGKPSDYKAVAYLRPHFQLDELTTSMRLVIELPSPAAK